MDCLQYVFDDVQLSLGAPFIVNNKAKRISHMNSLRVWLKEPRTPSKQLSIEKERDQTKQKSNANWETKTWFSSSSHDFEKAFSCKSIIYHHVTCQSLPRTYSGVPIKFLINSEG